VNWSALDQERDWDNSKGAQRSKGWGSNGEWPYPKGPDPRRERLAPAIAIVLTMFALFCASTSLQRVASGCPRRCRRMPWRDQSATISGHDRRHDRAIEFAPLVLANASSTNKGIAAPRARRTCAGFRAAGARSFAQGCKRCRQAHRESTDIQASADASSTVVSSLDAWLIMPREACALRESGPFLRQSMPTGVSQERQPQRAARAD
jgi:hypothetical protein